MQALRSAWRGFTKASEWVGEFISRRIVIPILYLVLGALFTLPTRMGDPLHLKRRPSGNWHDRRDHKPDSLDQARSMF